MTPGYEVSPLADRDLDDQANYLVREASVEVALRFYDAAASTFAKLAHQPAIGERRESLNPRLDGLRVSRIHGFEKSLVFYQTMKDGIQIVRVLHGARDIENLGE